MTDIPEPTEADLLREPEYDYSEAAKSRKYEVTEYPPAKEGTAWPPAWHHHESFHRDAEDTMQCWIRRAVHAERRLALLEKAISGEVENL